MALHAIVSPTQIEVQTACGQRFVVDRDLADCGYEFLLPSGQWVHESDPIVYSELASKNRNLEGYEHIIGKVLERNRQIYYLLKAEPLTGPRPPLPKDQAIG